MTDLALVSAEWLAAKEEEKQATARRRVAEDKLLSLIGVAETHEGITSADAPGGYKVKITSRLTRKVDAQKVQELAAENGLTDHLASLFRWSPSINMAAWKAAPESITGPLAEAIEVKPGRPSFKIEKEG